MVREDILAGLKNAISRGVPLDQAVRSFINAGYNPAEVHEAAANLGSVGRVVGVSKPSMMPQPQMQHNYPVIEGPSQAPQQSSQLRDIRPTPMYAKKSKGIGIIIFLVIFLLILIGGLIWVIFFGEEILDKILGA